MALKKRLLRVKLTLPSGEIVWDETLSLNVKVIKAALGIQAKATVDVGGLSQQTRQALLTQFTAYAKRLRENGDAGDVENVVPIEISAGYEDGVVNTLAPIFHGQVALCEPVSGPPNVVIRISAFTQQIEKSRLLNVAPDRLTFKQYCEWAAQQMGLKADVQTSMDETIIENPGRTVYNVAALLPDIQRYDRQNIAAFVDDDKLYVLDIGKVAKASELVTVDQFVGTPIWTEWGVEFTSMFDPKLKLAHPIQLKSILNPTVNVATMIAMRLEYNLTSRQNAFTVSVQSSPSAGAQ